MTLYIGSYLHRKIRARHGSLVVLQMFRVTRPAAAAAAAAVNSVGMRLSFNFVNV